MASVAPLRSERFLLKVQLAQRLVLYPGELYRVPAHYHLLRIAVGMAYVIQAGQDHILHPGQEMHLERAADMALVSAIKCEQGIVELFNIQNRTYASLD